MTKYDKALESINDLFSDMSVSKEETLSNLNALQEEINTMKDTLEWRSGNEKEKGVKGMVNVF